MYLFIINVIRITVVTILSSFKVLQYVMFLSQGLTQPDILVWSNQYQTQAKRSVDWTWEEDYVQKLTEHQELWVFTAKYVLDILNVWEEIPNNLSV